MNIFYLHYNPIECARLHNDKHVVKMILEYGQLMSTAHRVLDGIEYYAKTKNNRKIKRWLLSDERENILWKASHIKHPSGIWVRSSKENYKWLYSLWFYLLQEYTFRYGKKHSAERMMSYFWLCPTNIPNIPFTEPTPAMPNEFKVLGNSIQSYKNYYIGAKQHLANWKNRPTPDWFSHAHL
jgi:hypothetical protein